MSLARLQHEVEELRRRIEELKMKLTAEMKVRCYLIYSVENYDAKCETLWTISLLRKTEVPLYLRLYPYAVSLQGAISEVLIKA